MERARLSSPTIISQPLRVNIHISLHCGYQSLFPPIASFTPLDGISIDTQVRKSRTTLKRRKMISKERINWFCVWRICKTCKKTEWIKKEGKNKWKRRNYSWVERRFAEKQIVSTVKSFMFFLFCWQRWNEFFCLLVVFFAVSMTTSESIQSVFFIAPALLTATMN